MKPIRLLIAVLLLSGAGLPHARAQAGAVGAANTPFWTGFTDAASFSRAMDARLERARDTLGRLLAMRTAPTIDYPDSLPVFSFARNEGLRKRMYMEYQNRAYPKNMEVLDKMVESAKTASGFIDRIVLASGSKAKAEYEAILKRKQQDLPGATTVNAWESAYYSELVRMASYDFDSLSVRPYFPFDRVKQGLFDVTSTLVGVTYRPITNVPVWDPSVEAYEVLQNGQLLGRFCLDMHRRSNKYNPAAEFSIRTGITRQQIPEVAGRYRERILAPGGWKPAVAMVKGFLGRPFDFNAWEAWLNRDEP